MSEKLSMHRIMAVLLLVALCALTGCASKPAKPAGSGEPGMSTGGAEGSGAANQNAGAGSEDEVAGPQTGLLVKRTVYFDFDSAEIKGEGTDIVAAHAKYLAKNPATRVRLKSTEGEIREPAWGPFGP